MCDSVIVLELMFLFMLSVHLGLNGKKGDPPTLEEKKIKGKIKKEVSFNRVM